MRIKNNRGAYILEDMFDVLVKLDLILAIYVDEEDSLEDWGIVDSGKGWIVTVVGVDGIGKISSKSKNYRS